MRPEAVTASFSTWLPIESEIVSAADVSRNFSDDPKDYIRWDQEAARACAEYLNVLIMVAAERDTATDTLSPRFAQRFWWSVDPPPRTANPAHQLGKSMSCLPH
jgi:hypothetical protein